jgi:hypothetical protein
MKPEQLHEGMLCQLDIGRWGANKRLKKDKFGKDLPTEIIRGVQDLLEDKSLLDDQLSIKRSALGFLRRNSMPFPIDGIFWVPKHKIALLDEEFTKLKEEYEAGTNKIIRNLSKLKKDFERKYPDFYDESNYPSPSQLRKKYRFHWQFFQFDLPDKKAGILSPEMYKREKEKFDAMAKEMNDMTLNIIGNALLKKIERLQAQCEGDKINAGTVSSLERFMRKWEDLWQDNVDSEKFQGIMKSLRIQMARTSADRLKSNEDFRNKAAKKFDQITKQIKKVPDFKLKRKLDV